MNKGAHALGLACFFSTLLIYSTTVTPFQRFPYINSFVGLFAIVSLASTLLAALLVVLAITMKVSYSQRTASVVGSACYVVGSAGFVILALTGLGATSAVAPGALAVATGAGSVLVCVQWGRVCARYNLRQALILVAGASFLSAALRLLIAHLPYATAMALFFLCLLSAVILPCFVATPSAEDALLQAEEGEDQQFGVRSFLYVVAEPAAGVFAFAFIMGSMRFVYASHFYAYLLALVCAIGIVAVCVFGRWRMPLVRVAYRRAAVLVAVAALAAGYVAGVVSGVDTLGVFVMLLLYAFCMLLSLASLMAMAHAGEFPTEVVFASALVLFAGASLLGLLCAQFMAEEYTSAVAVIVTAAYAATLVVNVPQAEINPHEALAGVESSAALLPEKDTAQPSEIIGQVQNSDKLAQEYGLTKRETEILGYLAQGHSGAYISEVLFISPNTARTHIHNIYRKLDVTSREDILRLTHEQ